MTEEEISELYTRLAFQYESSIDAFLAKQTIDTNLVTTSREKCYDSLDKKKLRESKKVRDYHETMPALKIGYRFSMVIGNTLK